MSSPDRRPVLLIRPDGNERDAAALDAHGIASSIDPYLVNRACDDPMPARRLVGLLSAAGAQTALVITSPRTWGHLEAAAGAGPLERAVATALNQGLRVFATGRGTLDTLPEALADRAETAPTAKALVELLNDIVLPQIRALPMPVVEPLAILPGSRIARAELPEGLRAGGWRVMQLPVYTTDSRPEAPTSVGALARGAYSAVLLRSSSAARALARFAGPEGIGAGTRVIGAGPTTSATARELGLDVIECTSTAPAALAAELAGILGAPGAGAQGGGAAGDELGPEHPSRRPGVAAGPLLRAARGDRPERTPVWFMRQAGRSLPEYRAAREGTGMLESCLNPALAAELTLQPVRRYGVDAAIFYSDIMVPLKLAGVGVDIAPGVGPVLDRPVRTAADVDALPELGDEALEPIREAVRLVTGELGDVPLIGFAGAPYTVASYLVEGAPSATHEHTRALMRARPEVFDRLLDWVARADIAFLRAQVLAGASAIQLFDSWAGRLSEADYLVHAQPASGRVLRAIGRLGVPRIHFGTGTAGLLRAMRDAGADVMGVAADLTLARANDLLGGGTVLQGNLDPALLSGPIEAIDAALGRILAEGRRAPAHIVNLAHGVPKDTNPQVLAHIVDVVHGAGAEKGE
ncbi:Uroporphyrinogen decarboxylase [Propionibacterium australiense]|uniref:Uroporphyrinogen decarboxylase n=1 Tax=Propionibacterium australiense TaxID=119981 RepID=A0A383S4P0_9ACTN|nr:uroporphyrinogen decarboxylase [Propionibacterium australiense]SYZ32970.1 Uroporphyrinogen decarboxylase [Propionibacterium australiense]VEH92329.1 Uroporphyrinogen decarboxylase [Propionibacterium australiense]